MQHYLDFWEAFSNECRRLLDVGDAKFVRWTKPGLAILVPFELKGTSPIVITSMGFFNGHAYGGQFDIGIYDSNGIKIVSSGVISRKRNSLQVVDIPDTAFYSGVFYMALALNKNVDVLWAKIKDKSLPIYSIASSFPLSSDADLVPYNDFRILLIAALTRRIEQ